MRIIGRYSIAAVLLLFFVTSCSLCRHTPPGVTQRDSVFIRTTETVTQVDTVIMWKIPEGTAEAVLPDTDTSRLVTALAESEAWVEDGQLHHELRNRSDLTLPILIPVPHKVISSEKVNLHDEVRTVEVERQLSKWQAFWIRAGQISMAIFAVFLFIVVIIFIRKVYG